MGKGGDILFRYGNPQSYNHGTAANQVNFKQHNVHWIPDSLNDGGKIMLFNNGNDRPTGNYSSVDIISPLKDINGNYILEADTTFGPDSPEWSYVAPVPATFYSQNISSAQRLPNGNTLICQGRDGRFFEIDTNEDIVWEYWSPITSNGILSQGDTPAGNRGVFRALKYQPTYSAFNSIDMTPGLPIELNPDLTQCLTSMELVDNTLELNIYPNPVNDVLYITSNYSKNEMVKIYNTTGQLIYSESFTNKIDLSRLNAGLYFIAVGYNTKKIIIQ